MRPVSPVFAAIPRCSRYRRGTGAVQAVAAFGGELIRWSASRGIGIFGGTVEGAVRETRVPPDHEELPVKAISTVVSLSLEDADRAVRDALSEFGFGVLTEIDVAETLRLKLGVERAPLRILGACNPNLAHAALEADPNAALLLPCNVVLEAGVDGETKVSAVDPRELMPDPAMAELAADAAGRLTAALDRLSGAMPDGAGASA